MDREERDDRTAALGGILEERAQMGPNLAAPSEARGKRDKTFPRNCRERRLHRSAA